MFVAPALGADDGLSAASEVWQRAFRTLGAEVTTVAGDGRADLVLPGLAAGPAGTLDKDALAAALAGAGLVVVENPCSDRFDAGAGSFLLALLRGRRALLRHHDLPWQRPGSTDDSAPPDDASWRHVTVNERSRLELSAKGVRAETVYNMFDVEVRPGDRERTRAAVGAGEGPLLLQPTRAAASKNVAGGLLLASRLGASFWLLGPVEADYRGVLDRLQAASPVRFLTGKPAEVTLADAYAASDAVVLPSAWEGFGNAAIESALYRRAFAAGSYPVASELRRYGFSWFDPRDAAPLARFLASPDPLVLDRNEQVARLRFSSEQLPQRLMEILTGR